jgi:hypothetical protein
VAGYEKYPVVSLIDADEAEATGMVVLFTGFHPLHRFIRSSQLASQLIQLP